MNRNSAIVLGVIATVLVGGCCVLLVTLGLAGLAVFSVGRSSITAAAPVLTEIFATLPAATPTARPVMVLTPVPTPLPGAGDTLERLLAAEIPPNDLRELAMRLLAIPEIPVTVADAAQDYVMGERLEFNVSDTDTDQNFKVTATLIYATENVYFFAEEGLPVDAADVRELVDNFQQRTYPTTREFFGSEWNPGVDGDPHLYILYVRGLGSSVAGYYSSADQYSQLAHEYSNEKEMFYINADAYAPGDSALPGVLAHEFQHMIHWYHDRNEEIWMNEGAAVLAALLNGFDSRGFDQVFLSDPDLQLNAWTEGGDDDYSVPHYGAGFLFMTYFLDRFGEAATQTLVADSANGLHAVDRVLASLGLADPQTGRPISAVDLFADWVIANYLGDPDFADGRFAYHTYADAPRVTSPTGRVRACPQTETATVRQFAADYYEISCEGEVSVAFTGSRQVRVIPTEPHSGRYAFWSHRNDESDTMLTRAFDFTGLSTATLSYWAWWSIEPDYDYAYVLASTNEGRTWEFLQTPSGTDVDPTGNNFGWGYTGASGGGRTPEWVQETIDLSDYAGQKILVRFEYVTDAAVNRAGFMLDDLAVPELNYAEDFERGDGEWEALGFVRMDNILPQTFVVQLIRRSADGSTASVQRVPIDAANTGRLTFDLAAGETAILVVSGTTLFTTEPASYQFDVR